MERLARRSMWARMACWARRRRSSGGSLLSGSISRSKRLRKASRAGLVRALRSPVRLQEISAAIRLFMSFAGKALTSYRGSRGVVVRPSGRVACVASRAQARARGRTDGGHGLSSNARRAATRRSGLIEGRWRRWRATGRVRSARPGLRRRVPVTARKPRSGPYL